MSIRALVLRDSRLVRELGQGIVLLAITGSSVGGFLGMLAIATRALGR
ncbi:MAG: hypothetical protein ACRDJS_00280 [Actinomycetota bacterium]|jgi:hypothetical protein